ncbi:DUF2992 family protein [Staphylococcus agnetis]|uniref:DUF2992 family protein n=1 Tax=Staphylococcus agnetis TaxID=985762 RepID=UPI00155A534D|nr:DUF2992 family protein [Staphylococcus agnetis]MBY7665231.1 DUF2992 family protein [Staphylococcus agnetis]
MAKYTFGTEPDRETILKFIDKKLLNLINKSKAEIKHRSSSKKINPKRLQRQVAKEKSNHHSITRSIKKRTRAQEKSSKKRISNKKKQKKHENVKSKNKRPKKNIKVIKS